MSLLRDRLRQRLSGDDGSVLVLAMLFLGVAFLLVTAPLSAASTAANAGSTAARERTVQYDAQAAVGDLVEAFRTQPTWGTAYDSSCHTAVVSATPGGTTFSATCLGLLPTTPLGNRWVRFAVTAAGPTSYSVEALVQYGDLPTAGNSVSLTTATGVHS